MKRAEITTILKLHECIKCDLDKCEIDMRLHDYQYEENNDYDSSYTIFDGFGFPAVDMVKCTNCWKKTEADRIHYVNWLTNHCSPCYYRNRSIINKRFTNLAKQMLRSKLQSNRMKALQNCLKLS